MSFRHYESGKGKNVSVQATQSRIHGPKLEYRTFCDKIRSIAKPVH